MTRPVLPPVPDVVPFEDEPAKQALRDWAEAYALACTLDAANRYLEQLQRARDSESRLRYPDTTGS